MTTLPHGEHAARRKVYAPHYNPSHLIQFEPEVKDSVIKVVNVSGVPFPDERTRLISLMMQILENQQGKMSVSCPEVFRHLMVDIISTTVFGSRSGAIDNYAMGIRDVLSQAIQDFPTRGIVVCIKPMHRDILISSHISFSGASFRHGPGALCAACLASHGGASAVPTA